MLLKDLIRLHEVVGSAAHPAGEYTFQGTGNYGVGGYTQLANGQYSEPTQALEDQEQRDIKTQMDDAIKSQALEEQQLANNPKSSWDARPVKDAEFDSMTGTTQLVKAKDHLNGYEDNTYTPSVLGGTGALAAPKNFTPQDPEVDYPNSEISIEEDEPVNLESLIRNITKQIMKGM